MISVLIIYPSVTHSFPPPLTESTLVLPYGSYMEKCDLSRTYLEGDRLRSHCVDTEGRFFSGKYGINNYRSMFDTLSCWLGGGDITFRNIGDGPLGIFRCDDATSTAPINAANFLYSEDVPTGSYLKECRGLLRADEGGRSFLYATCISNNNAYPQKLDITECQGKDIYNDHGRLRCRVSSNNQVDSVVSGSYLQECDLGQARYDSLQNRLYARCGSLSLSLGHISECINSGFDIVLSHDQLQCLPFSQEVAAFHTPGSFLPRGNYLLTCIELNYYPSLMRGSASGTLVGLCEEQSISNKNFSMLSDAENCQLNGSGYISNVNGRLQCDLDVNFPTDFPR